VNNWSSNNNAVFANKGQALDDVTVSLSVTQDLVTENNAGFTLQLNCTPMPGVSVVGIPLNWLQYVIYIDNFDGNHPNTACYQWQAWAVGNTGWPEGKPAGVGPSNQPVPGIVQPNSPVIATDVNNYLAAGSNVTITLMTDPASHGITQATFTVQLAGEETKPALTLPFSKSVPFNFANGDPGVPFNAQFPIAAFQALVVGPGNCSTATFISGAGELTYSVKAGSSLSVQDGGVIGTCEKSNISYGQVIPAAVGPIELMSPPYIQQFGYVEPNLGTGGGSVAGGDAQKFGQPTHHIMADHLDVGAWVPGRP
jgi:hypothetical protein